MEKRSPRAKLRAPQEFGLSCEVENESSARKRPVKPQGMIEAVDLQAVSNSELTCAPSAASRRVSSGEISKRRAMDGRIAGERSRAQPYVLFEGTRRVRDITGEII